MSILELIHQNIRGFLKFAGSNSNQTPLLRDKQQLDKESYTFLLRRSLSQALGHVERVQCQGRCFWSRRQSSQPPPGQHLSSRDVDVCQISDESKVARWRSQIISTLDRAGVGAQARAGVTPYEGLNLFFLVCWKKGLDVAAIPQRQLKERLWHF